MRITILAMGSRGDIQPMVALGVGLHDAGHGVRIATHSNFETWIQAQGLDFAPLEGDAQSMVNSAQGQAWVETGRNSFKMVQGFRQLMRPVLPRAMHDGLEASKDADLLVISGPSFYIGVSIAEKLNLPYIQAYLQPIHPTTEFSSALFPAPIKGGRIFNYLTHAVGGQSMWHIMRPIVNEARRDVLHLPPYSPIGPWPEMQRQKLPVVYGYSRHVLPKPGNWHDFAHVTGYWFLQEKVWTPPQTLVDFLDDGPPPVYIGFGSMVDRDPQRMTELVLEALKYSNRRAILLRGWGGLRERDLPPHALMIDQASHEWLFPRMAAVVHHGGAGTTAAAFRSGTPSIVVPFFADQPFWAERVATLGVGVGPLPRKHLTSAKLAGAIDRATSDQTMRERAVALSVEIRAEDGVARAVEVMKAYAQRIGILSTELATA